MYQKKHTQLHKALALLLSLSLILTGVFGGTFAQIITKTPSFINTFLSGLDPSGDLIIRKEVTHPFGDGYVIPEGLNFTFTVSLGDEYAGKTVATSQGAKTANEHGNITVITVPDGAVRIKNLPDGTDVIVTEHSAAGFTPSSGAEQFITIQSGENHIAYINAYAPAPASPVNVTVSGTKLLDGRDWQEGDSFTFQLEYKLAENENWQSAGTTSVSYDSNNADFNKFSFSESVQGITYSSAGEYAFRVSEVEGTVPGITYDKVVSYFDVTVGDADMDGALEIQNVKGYQNARASYDESTGNYHVDVTVNNKYAPTGTATAIINIDKQVMSLSGEEKSAAGYTFDLYNESGNLVATSGKTSAAGETSIELTFEAKDAGESFHYTLKETHGGETINGMVYAGTVYPITVSIVDNLDGTISAYVYSTDAYQTELIEIEPEETEPEETEPTEATEPAEKTEPTEATDPAEATVPTEETVPTEVTDPTEATESTGETEPTSETEPTKGSEPTDSTEPTAEQPVQTEPMITASEPATESATDPVPTNSASETTEDNQLLSFILAPLEFFAITTEASEIEEAATECSDNDTDNEADILTANNSTPQAKEVAVIPEGASNSYTVYFVNTYDPADTSASFGGTKELTGRNMNEGEFIFDLYATGDNFTISEDQKPIQSIANDATGKFDFAAIGYSNVGTYRYVVKENTSVKLGGVTYDDSVFHVIVTVTDKNGTLNAHTAITDNFGNTAEIKFQNSYKAAGTSISLSGTKTLTGMDLTEAMFRFQLYKADEHYNIQGADQASAANDASGQFSFQMDCPESGTFYYVLKEDASADVKGMTYDDTVYGVKVRIEDDGSGALQASVTLTVVGGDEVDAILFENSYSKPIEPTDPSAPIDPSDPTEPSDPTDPSDPTEPSDPTDPSDPTEPSTPTKPTKPSTPADPDVPPTGDENQAGLYITLVVISILAIVLLLLTRKKQPEGRYLRK